MWTIDQFERMYVPIDDKAVWALERDGNPAKRSAGKSLREMLTRWQHGEYNAVKDSKSMDEAAACL